MLKKNIEAPPDLIKTIQQQLIENYQKFYKYTFADLQEFFEKTRKLNLFDIENTHFFEHCIIDAANGLHLLHEIKDIVILEKFARTSQLNPQLMSILLGMEPSEHEKEESKAKLGNLVETTVEGLKHYIVNDMSFNLEQIKFQKVVFLTQMKANIILITNPFIIAQYIIDYEDKFQDSVALFAACEYLINKMELFVGLKNGIPLNIIANLSTDLIHILIKRELAKKTLIDQEMDISSIHSLINIVTYNKSISKNQATIFRQLLLTYSLFYESESDEDKMSELRYLISLYKDYPEEAFLFLFHVGNYIAQSDSMTAWLILHPLLNHPQIKETFTLDIKNTLANLLMGIKIDDLEIIFSNEEKTKLLQLKYQLLIYLLKEEASKKGPNPIASLLINKAIHYLMTPDNKIDSLECVPVSFKGVSCVFYSLTVLKRVGHECLHLYNKEVNQLIIMIKNTDRTKLSSFDNIQKLTTLLLEKNITLAYCSDLIFLLRELLQDDAFSSAYKKSPLLTDLINYFSDKKMILPYEIFSYDNSQIMQFMEGCSLGLPNENRMNELPSFSHYLDLITDHFKKILSLQNDTIADDTNVIVLTENTSSLFSNSSACVQLARVVGSYFNREDITIVLNKTGIIIQHDMNGSKNSLRDKMLHDFIGDTGANFHIEYNEENKSCKILIKHGDDIVKLVEAFKFPADYFFKQNNIFQPTYPKMKEKCLVM